MSKRKKIIRIYHVGELVSLEYLYKKIHVLFATVDQSDLRREISGLTVDISCHKKKYEENYINVLFGTAPDNCIVETFYQLELDQKIIELYIDQPEFID